MPDASEDQASMGFRGLTPWFCSNMYLISTFNCWKVQVKEGARTSPDTLFLLIGTDFVGSLEWDLIVKYWLGVQIAKDRIVSLFHLLGSHKLSCTATLSCTMQVLFCLMFSNLEPCLGQCKSYGKFHCCLMFVKPPKKIATGPYIQKSYLESHHVFGPLVWASNFLFYPLLEVISIGYHLVTGGVWSLCKCIREGG